MYFMLNVSITRSKKNKRQIIPLVNPVQCAPYLELDLLQNLVNCLHAALDSVNVSYSAKCVQTYLVMLKVMTTVIFAFIF